MFNLFGEAVVRKSQVRCDQSALPQPHRRPPMSNCEPPRVVLVQPSTTWWRTAGGELSAKHRGCLGRTIGHRGAPIRFSRRSSRSLLG